MKTIKFWLRLTVSVTGALMDHQRRVMNSIWQTADFILDDIHDGLS